jgi:sigma-B regulation protein RsbU (phosphoserine phosphatase)
MGNFKSVSAWCQSAIKELGKVGVTFVICLLIFAVLTVTGNRGLLLIFDTLVLCVTGIIVAVRLLRRYSRRSLWSLRNRLLIVYGLIGILPILLILTLVGISAWALTSELATFLARSELDRRLNTIRGAAETVEKIPVSDRKYAAPNIVEYFKVRFPGLRLYIEDATGSHAYPAGSPPLNLPPGWRDASGLLEHDGQFYGWAHITHDGETFTAIAPLTDSLIADLVPNLGQIILSEYPHGRGDSDSLNSKAAKGRDNPDFEYKNGKWINKRAGSGHRFAIHNAGKLPPPVSRFDVAVDWPGVFPHYDWNEPNVKHGAVLMVRSRPSAVLSAIFTGTDQIRSLLLALMIGVAVLFLLVEIVALVIGVSLSRRVTRAINELYEGTRRVIYGDFRHRIPVHGDDQLGELTVSFNQMTGNLERLLSVEKEKERLQAELEIAREVQTQLYPRSAPPACGLRLTVHCEPARVVSGDYYDYETVRSNKLAFAIGDVAGKGISAALLMATVQAALRAQIRSGIDRPSSERDSSLASAKLVSELNQQLYAHTAPEKYATFFFALYDEPSCTLTYTNAGHLSPILIRKGEATLLDTNGTVVGAFPFAEYDESKLKLRTDDLLVFYTDGITEPENAYGEMFGEQRLIELVARSVHEDDQMIIRKVIDAVRDWHSAPELPDDMTLMIARCLEAR